MRRTREKGYWLKKSERFNLLQIYPLDGCKARGFLPVLLKRFALSLRSRNAERAMLKTVPGKRKEAKKVVEEELKRIFGKKDKIRSNKSNAEVRMKQGAGND